MCWNPRIGDDSLCDLTHVHKQQCECKDPAQVVAWKVQPGVVVDLHLWTLATPAWTQKHMFYHYFQMYYLNHMTQPVVRLAALVNMSGSMRLFCNCIIFLFPCVSNIIYSYQLLFPGRLLISTCICPRLSRSFVVFLSLANSVIILLWETFFHYEIG